MNARILNRFKQASLRQRVVHRFAMDFPTEEARKEYLKEHPNADKSKHKVTKGSPEIDAEAADDEARKAKSRYDDNKRNFQELKKLGLKDKNKYGQGYKKLEESGEKAVKAAREMMEKYEKISEGTKGNRKRQREAMLDWFDSCVREFNQAKNDFGGTSADRLANLYAGAQKLESALQALPKLLKGEDNVEIDESWRDP